MSWQLDAASEKKLAGVHPDLVAVVRRATMKSARPFVVFEGVRTLARERQLIAAGRSALKDPMRCRHVPKAASGLGGRFAAHAVDLVDHDGLPIGKGWDARALTVIGAAMKAAAKDLSISIEWGGDWRFRDMAHFQLPWARYP